MSIQVGIGFSAEKDPLQAARNAAGQAKSNLRAPKYSLAIVFATTEFSHSLVLKTIIGLLGPVNIIGCSGLAVISNQGLLKHGLTIMLLGLEENVFFNTACVKEISSKSVTLSGDELGEKLLYGFKEVRRSLGMIFSDGLISDGSGFLNGLQEKLGASFPIAGASASDNLSFKRTYVYFDNETLSDAACGLLWGGRLNFGLGNKHGWKPLGKPRYVTKASANYIYEIDGQPAANIYKEYLACDLSRLRKELKRISILYPIGVYLPGEEEYLLRNILSVDDNQALLCQGNVPEGSQIRLMIGTKESCLAAVSQACQEVKAGLFGRKANFVLVFDSISRYILLGRQANNELKIIKENLGKDTPIIGVYTYGEQAPLKAINYQGKTHFHNQSITILGIAE